MNTIKTALLLVLVLLGAEVLADTDKDYDKLIHRVFEDSHILTKNEISELKKERQSSSEYYRVLGEVYKISELSPKILKILKTLSKDYGTGYVKWFASHAWFLFDKKALEEYDALTKNRKVNKKSSIYYCLPDDFDKKWKEFFSKVILEKEKLNQILSNIKPVNKVERILLRVTVNHVPSGYFADLPEVKGTYYGYQKDDDDKIFIEKPELVKTARIDRLSDNEILRLREGKYVYWPRHLYITLKDDESRRVQFIIRLDMEYGRTFHVKILKPACTCDKIICFPYRLNEKQLATILKETKDIVLPLKNKIDEIEQIFFEEYESKEARDMCEKNDLACSKKPRNAFPVTWRQKERIRKYLEKLDLDGLKKYAKGKNVNFNYIHRDYSALYPVIDATAKDKDNKRFVEFLDFMTKHGFDIQVLNFFKLNPLFEAVDCANSPAFKELVNRRANLKLKFLEKSLLQYAQNEFKDNNEITPEQKRSWKNLVKNKQRAAKVLKTRIIPYLKSLKDPKTGKPLFKE